MIPMMPRFIFKIIHTEKGHEDYVVVSAPTLEKVQEIVRQQLRKRNWKEEDCRSIDLSWKEDS